MDEVCNAFVAGDPGQPEKGSKAIGRKAYHPVDLLKLLVYGYFNGVSSSRKLERECHRNIEVQWLVEGLAPDHKTISDFRTSNSELICGLFLFLLSTFKGQGLATGRAIAVDGTKIKAYASREIHLDSLKKKLENIEIQVDKYLSEMASIDDAEDSIEELEERKSKLSAELEELEHKKNAFQADMIELESKGLKRKCVTDTDAKTMKARYGTFFGYNFQIAVDTKSHIVTEYLVVDNQNDKGLLAPMVEGSAELMGEQADEVLADAGYYKISELEGLENNGTECFVAVNNTGSQLKDREIGVEFVYNREKDRYTCSQDRILDFHRIKTENGEEKRIYRSRDCSGCPLVDSCTKNGRRTYTRNQNQDWLDRYKEKMGSEKGKEKLTERKSVAEHPFATMKYYMGQMPTVLRGREKVSSEMGLYTIAYNLKRYLTLKYLNHHAKPIENANSTSKFLFLFLN
jgi:transposase